MTSGDPRPKLRVLAIDASLARCSAAVLTPDGPCIARSLETVRGHAALLPCLIEDVLKSARLRATDLGSIAVVVGPGGFTGLRAALALSNGLSLAARVPLIGVTTGEALAAAVADPIRAARAVWSAVDNRRGQVLLERLPMGRLEAEGAPLRLQDSALPHPTTAVVVVGDAGPAVAARLAARGADVLLSDVRLPDAAAVARLASLRLSGRLGPRSAQPLYVEPPATSKAERSA